MIDKNTGMFLRGAGAFLVILAHYSQWYLTLENNRIAWLLSKTGRYGVAVFFLVSGYGLVFSAKRGLDYRWLCRRLNNVYLPYLCIWGIICLFEKREWSALNLVKYLSGMDMWFVFVILLFYILFYIVWKFSRKKILWMAVGVSVISIILAVTVKSSVWYSSNYAFLIGIVAGRYDESIGVWLQQRKAICCGILLFGFLCSGVIYTYFTNKSEFIYILGKITASILYTLFILGVFAYREKTNWIFMKTGAISLELYLVHNFVLLRLSLVKEKIGAAGVLLFSLLLSVVFSLILHEIFGLLQRRMKRKYYKKENAENKTPA